LVFLTDRQHKGNRSLNLASIIRFTVSSGGQN